MGTAVVARRLPSFEDFYREHWHGATRLAASVAGSEAAGEDIAQDVFQKMYRRWGVADEPAAYLRVAIVNGCRSYHRRRKTEVNRLPALAETDQPASVAGELDDIVCTLPHRQRTVVQLRYWDGLSEAEIAEVLGCKPGTVKSLASRAKDRMVAALT